jgi:2,5-diamino-6-(ribosylamino)-4(3H)-pyrimidinone 5'-phosphate reductase
MMNRGDQMLPYVFIHNEMSLDGRLDWMLDDQGLYYETIAHFEVDAMLSGSNTILDAEWEPQASADGLAFKPGAKNFADPRQLLVVVDSRGRVENWLVIRNQPYWRDVVVLCSRSTPQAYLDHLREEQVDFILAGEERVDLGEALTQLRQEYRVESIRVDSGGVLNGALLRAGLVDEIVVIINPCLTGGSSPRSLFVAEDLTSWEGVIPLALKKSEVLRDGYLFLQYEIVKQEDAR